MLRRRNPVQLVAPHTESANCATKMACHLSVLSQYRSLSRALPLSCSLFLPFRSFLTLLFILSILQNPMFDRLKSLLLTSLSGQDAETDPGSSSNLLDADRFEDCRPYDNPMPGDSQGSGSEDEFCPDPIPTNNNDKVLIDPSLEFGIGTLFASITDAKKAATEFCRCPIIQRSARQHKYFYFECFRSGTSKITNTQQPQRKLHSKKCSCPFKAVIKKVESGYQVISITPEHNHELYTEEELQQLPQNRFIPEDVQEKITSLFLLGNLNTGQIMTLIEKEHFPDVKVTWNKRDVQNLTQKLIDRNNEATEFIERLEEKRDGTDKWRIRTFFCRQTRRLERVFWMSGKGIMTYQNFLDVLEGDATYKTNRFGMPLVLFTVVDNNGITSLVGGALISDETCDSYTWVLQQLKVCGEGDPKVFFTDGDLEFAKAIRFVFPQTVHLLCRWHIAQNITKKLAGELRKDLNQFLDDFWRVGSIEEMDEYITEWELLKTKWSDKPATVEYIDTLQAKQVKWAFAFTHCHFVAGISSTQRQESINYQTKADLISNSTLSQLITCFEHMDEKLSRKVALATLNTKLSINPATDPIIEISAQVLTGYAAQILKEECALSLSYLCELIVEQEEHINFKVSHRDRQDKFRIVRFAKESESHLCSCRKDVWHGIVCRHVITVLRRMNVLRCPLGMFNARWRREFTSLQYQSINRVERELTMSALQIETVSDKERYAERTSRLLAAAKDVISRCVYNHSNFDLVETNLVSLQKIVHSSTHQEQLVIENHTSQNILNPLKVKTKGRPKQKRTREKSVAEQQRQKAKQRSSSARSNLNTSA